MLTILAVLGPIVISSSFRHLGLAMEARPFILCITQAEIRSCFSIYDMMVDLG